MTIEYVSLPGETAPPVPDGPKLCSGDDMRILHNAFLWAYEAAPGLVHSAPAGDTARSEFVGQWLADLDATLHTHHESEDELLWGKLEQRAPACALHVGQMRAHHAQVAALLEEAGPPPRPMARDGRPGRRRTAGRCLRADARGAEGAPAPRSRRGRPGRGAGGHGRGVGGDGRTQCRTRSRRVDCCRNSGCCLRTPRRRIASSSTRACPSP